MLKAMGYLIVFISISSASGAAELAIKYDFEPRKTYLYKTSVIEPKASKSKIEPLVIKPQLHHYRKLQSNVQVVAARNYTHMQPLAPTISMSYFSKTKEFKPVVIAANNYQTTQVNVTTSDLASDYLNTFVVGNSYKSQGFEQESKLTDLSVEQQITRNSLLGCAPLNINCSRTARDSAKGNLPSEAPTAPKSNLKQQRQQLPN
jgi:hypothetical protein